MIINLEHPKQVKGCILGSAPYRDEVITVGQAPSTIQLEANQLYEIHGNSYVPTTMQDYQISPIAVLEITRALTAPYAIEPAILIFFRERHYLRALLISGNGAQLCPLFVNSVSVPNETCPAKISVDGRLLNCCNGRTRSRVIQADVLCKEYQTLIIEASKGYRHSRLSSSIPMKFSGSIIHLLQQCGFLRF